jgi:hypothetical protein
MKIAEQSRNEIKNWINYKTDPRYFVFTPKSSVTIIEKYP